MHASSPPPPPMSYLLSCWPYPPYIIDNYTVHALTLQCCGCFRPKHMDAKIFENHLNLVILVFIGKLSLSTLIWVPICQGFWHFSVFLHHFVMAKLATSSIRVNPPMLEGLPCWLYGLRRCHCFLAVSHHWGPALMAVWSKALPLNASCLSPLRACPDGCVV